MTTSAETHCRGLHADGPDLEINWLALYVMDGMANLWITLIKDCALISVVGTNELSNTAKPAAGPKRQYLVAAALH